MTTTTPSPENLPPEKPPSEESVVEKAVSEKPVAEATAEIELDHDLAEVWQALVDAERLADWMGADTTIEPVTGGRLYTSDVVTGEPKHGVITELDREQRLSFDWWPVDEPERISHVTLVLVPSRRGTLVTVTESVAAVGGVRRVQNLAGVQQWRLALLSVAIRPSLGASSRRALGLPAGVS